MMKKLIFTSILVLLTMTLSAQTQTTKTIQKDSVPLFYGLTAKQMTSLTISEAKTLIKEKEISVDDYFDAKARANIYLNKIQIKKDSIETVKIYARIEKKLGVKKKNE